MGDLLEEARQAAVDFFKTPISVARVGELIVVEHEGRLLSWDAPKRAFRLLGFNLNRLPVDGLIELPEEISSKAELKLALKTSERFFREQADLKADPGEFGFEAEDLFMQICQRLGFELTFEKDPSRPFTVRRASEQEDSQQMTDLVLTVPTGIRQLVATVPLQITGAADQRKKKAAQEREVALVVFRGKQDINWPKLLRGAADGHTDQLWLCSQMLKFAIFRYGLYYVTFPAEPMFQISAMRSFNILMLKSLRKDIRTSLGSVVGGNALGRRQQHYEILVEEFAKGNPYEIPKPLPS